MPGPRLEMAERLVHLVELREQFGDQPVRRAVIGEQVVADAVAARAPQQLVAVEAEVVAGGQHVAPVAQLERGVEVPVLRVLHQVDGVMIGAAAQEREEVAHPVRHAEAEHVAIEVGDLLDVFDEERDVAELVRHDALLRKFLVRELAALEHLHHGALRVLERHHLGDRRLGVVLALRLDAVRRGLLLERAEIVVGRRAGSRAARIRMWPPLRSTTE